MTDDRRQRGTVFGTVAWDYERLRPGYPDAIADLALAGLGARSAVVDGPVRALESGAGTGKATRVFAGRGLDLTVVEPDPQMLEVLEQVLREVVPPSAPGRLTLVNRGLEDLAGDVRRPPYDLVYAAASWHWVDPDTRWVRAAALLRPGGVIALFGGAIEPEDEELTQAIERWHPDVPRPVPRDLPDAPGGMRWPGTDLQASPFFAQVEQLPLPVSSEWPADDYVGLLGTVSAFRIVPAAERAERLAGIRALLPDPVPVRHDVTLHRAVRTAVTARWPED